MLSIASVTAPDPLTENVVAAVAPTRSEKTQRCANALPAAPTPCAGNADASAKSIVGAAAAHTGFGEDRGSRGSRCAAVTPL